MVWEKADRLSGFGDQARQILHRSRLTHPHPSCLSAGKSVRRQKGRRLEPFDSAGRRHAGHADADGRLVEGGSWSVTDPPSFSQ
ncbi:hypothetical protein, partial [Nonomuraea jabiensis]|uniref:hypothetical protein n=1 Tax=Nonomuraea jabiensis TaxID=882448 RepID=UPI00368CC86B